MKSKELKNNFWWVGTLDPDLKVFDIVIPLDTGTTYNSYLLKDTERNVLFDTTKGKFADEYIKSLESVIPISEIDTMVVSHTEPDHSGALEKILDLNPGIEIYATMGAFTLMKELLNRDVKGIIVKDGDEISTGKNSLRFIQAPNLHWPDTMFTYIPEEKILVTCDSFSAHFSYDHIVYDDAIDKEKYIQEARLYFDGIIKPFRPDLLKAIDKIDGLDIDIIANGHGPVLDHNPRFVVDLYRQWASEPTRNQKKTVIIPYVSAHDCTRTLAKKIKEGIEAAGDINVKLFDMVTSGHENVMAEIEKSDGFLLGTPTIVGEALSPIWNIAGSMNARVHGGRFAGAFGSYCWSGEGVPHIMERLKQLKLKLVGEGFRVRFKPSEDDLKKAYEYGKLFGTAVLTDTLPE